MDPIEIRKAEARDAIDITAIYNQGIAERSATFDTEPRRIAEIEQRIADTGRYPMLVAEDVTGSVLGWVGVSPYRPRACYVGVGEVSIYLDASARGRRIGSALMRAVVPVAQQHGYWKLLSRVFTFNAASRALCRSCGFREVGVYERHARLEGRWLDVVIVERLIDAGGAARYTPPLVSETHGATP